MPFDGTDWQPEPERPLWLIVREIVAAERAFRAKRRIERDEAGNEPDE